MKKYIYPVANGGLRYKNDDFVDIFQNEPYKAIVAILKGLYGDGPFVVSGCKVTGTSPNLTISNGYIFLDGDIHYFAGATNISAPFYFSVDTPSFLSRLFKNLVTTQTIKNTAVKIQNTQPSSGDWISGDGTGMTDNNNGNGTSSNGGGGANDSILDVVDEIINSGFNNSPWQELTEADITTSDGAIPVSIFQADTIAASFDLGTADSASRIRWKILGKTMFIQWYLDYDATVSSGPGTNINVKFFIKIPEGKIAKSFYDTGTSELYYNNFTGMNNQPLIGSFMTSATYPNYIISTIYYQRNTDVDTTGNIILQGRIIIEIE